MATPTRTNKIQSHQDAIAKAKAGKGMKADLAKASKKPMSPEELEKLNVKAVDAEQAEIVADASSASKAAAGTESTSTLGAVGGESVAAAEGGAAAGATVSPAVIGAGVLGAVVIAAAAGGSSGGGSNSSSQPPLGDGNNKQNQNQQQPQQPQQPGKQDDKTDTGDKTNPQDNKTDEPVQPQYGQATAQGTAADPKVAVDGETKLASSKEAFIAKLTEAGKTDASQQFIRIDRILAAEGSDPDARMVRYPEQADAQGAASSARLKAPAATPAEASKLTAYEVVKVPGGITRAEAEAAAEKMGGKLMVVDNEAEATWLKDSFRNLLGSDAVGNGGAWIGGSKLTGASEINAAVRNEAATDIDYSKAAGDKLTAFVVEIPNYQHPLTLDGKPVAEGQVINADDFDKLVWNADGNKGGKISFSVVDSAEATEAGATKGELTVTESTEVQRPLINGNTGGGNRNPNVGANTDTAPETETPSGNGNQGGPGGSTGGSTGGNVKLPTYPDSNTQAAQVAQDKTDATLSADLFKGSDAANAPQFIKITNVKLPDVSEDNKTKALVFETAEGTKNEVVNGESDTVVNQTFFHKIVWNAALANGGTIEFVPVADAQGTAIPGAEAQTITITETPPQANQDPSKQGQPDSNASQDPGAGENQQPPGGQQNQENSGQKQAPAYDNPSDIKAAVTHDNASYSFEAQKSLLEGTGATKATHVKITEIKKNASDAADAGTLKYDGQDVNENTVIDLSQLSKLVWNAALAQGGSFKFTPVQADGQPIANGPAAQTMTIEEADAPSQQKVPTYADGNQHTAQVAHDAQAHTFEAMKAAFEGNHATDKATHVKITEIKKGGGENADAGTLKYKDGNVEEGAVIEVAELGKLVWNASMADGGSFKFTAVQANGEAFTNAPATQTVTINEHREAPAYDELNQAENVRENKTHTFDASLFNGTKVEAQPQYIKITEIKNGTGTNAEAATLLKGSDPVTLNQVIAAADFDKIKWDASKNDNGHFKFIPVVDEQGNPHEGAVERTVTITETAYTPAAENKQVDKNAVTALEKALFDHSVEDKAEPAYIKITAIDPRADELAAERIVRTVGQDDNVTKTAYQVVKAGAEGITLEAAKAAAKAMGGELLEISDQAELDWIKASTELMGKLNLEAASGDVTKGAWFTNPSDNLATGAADKEVIFSTGTEADNFSFEDAEAATGKASAYVVEFANYNPQQPGLLVEGDSPAQKNPVVVGETSAIIAADKLEKLSWDSMFNNGGTIKFVEVTAIDGNEQAEGAKEKTINITEKAEAGEVVAKSFDGGQNLSALLGTEDLNNPVI